MEFIDTTFQILSQFTGGQGGVNNSVQFIIGIFFWGSLVAFTWMRKKGGQNLPHEKLMLWGFSLGLGREIFMFIMSLLVSYKIVSNSTLHIVFPPFEHAVMGAALVTVAASFILYLYKDAVVTYRYLKIGLGIIILCYLTTFWWWGQYINSNPEAKFGQVWCDLLFHATGSILLIFPIYLLLWKTEGWVRNTVCSALFLFFVYQFFKIPDILLGEIYEEYFAPIRHGSYLAAIPMFGYVYVRELNEKNLQAEKELRKSRKDWKRTFDSINEIITLQDKNLKIVRANKAACKLFGLAEKELIGQNCYEMFRGVDEPCPKCPLIDTLFDGYEHSATITHSNLGKVFNISLSSVFDENSNLEYLIHVAQDITKQKKLEEELFQAQKMEAIGTLAGGIAHDFNNILSGLVGYAELIQDEVAPDSRVGRDIVEVIGAAKRAADLVKQILTFSRKTENNKQPLRPHLIVKEALKLLRATLPTSIDIIEQIDPDCGTVQANPTNIHQVVVNLCTNALHAMSDEKGVLRVGLDRREVGAAELIGVEVASPGTFVVLSVSDTGCGMDKATVDHIFEPYFTTKEVGTGTGLGLAVIHGIVQDAQGFIKVKSALGKGSTFEVYLPALQEKGLEEDVFVQDAPPQQGHERILVVDDEAFLVRVTQRQLEGRGYRVTATTDSREALEKIRTAPDAFDLLITDQTMPGLTGAELATAVKEIQPDMPIILCTGHSSVLSREKSKAIGIERYVFKPMMGNELFDAVREVLDKK